MYWTYNSYAAATLLGKTQDRLARSEGLEPSTFGAEIRRSILLNYER